MTRLPMESWNVVGWDEGQPYELNHRCAVPGCIEPGVERHHVWRRSFLGGDYWWVQTENGARLGNCVGLCNRHHRFVTDNETMIVVMSNGTFQYQYADGTRVNLSWQPPVNGREAVELLVTDELHDHDGPGECPTCHQKIKPPKIQGPPEEKKNRRTWAVAVPKDDQENGADVLDTLIEAAREELDAVGIVYGDGHKYNYHVLATSMALFVTHAKEVLSNG